MLNSQHLKALGPDVESGFWVMGGASLDEPIKEGQPPKINGSVMMAVAETKEEVLEKLKKDAYAKDVWNFDKVGYAHEYSGKTLCPTLADPRCRSRSFRSGVPLERHCKNLYSSNRDRAWPIPRAHNEATRRQAASPFSLHEYCTIICSVR